MIDHRDHKRRVSRQCVSACATWDDAVSSMRKDTIRTWNISHLHVSKSNYPYKIHYKIYFVYITKINNNCTLLCILHEYRSGKDFPHRLHFRGLSDVCNFCTWIRRSVLRPHFAGQSSHANTGFSDTKKSKHWIHITLLLCCVVN